MHPDQCNILLSIARAHKERKSAAEDMMEAVKNLEEAKRHLTRCVNILAGKEPTE